MFIDYYLMISGDHQLYRVTLTNTHTTKLIIYNHRHIRGEALY